MAMSDLMLIERFIEEDAAISASDLIICHENGAYFIAYVDEVGDNPRMSGYYDTAQECREILNKLNKVVDK